VKRSRTVLSMEEQRRIEWMEGDAENLDQIPDNTFDAYTIAYGIRNCVHIDQVGLLDYICSSQFS
jgi:ubiquinone/menaquinone biosynthesis C-methylase UbiE